MHNIFDQFREKSQDIRVTPHTGTWDRIDSRLRERRSARKLFRSRTLGYAAVVLCLILGSIVIVERSQSVTSSGKLYSESIEELDTSPDATESIYDIDRIQGYYTMLQ